MLPLYVSNSIHTGVDVLSLTVPYPLNETSAIYPPNSPPQSGESQWLVVCYRRFDNSSIAAPTVTGWTAAITPSTGTGVHVGVYYKQGNGDSGGAIITWAATVICGAAIILVDRSATVSPVDFASAIASTGPNAFGIHSISSQSTNVNDVFVLGIWFGPGDDGYWTQFGQDVGYFYGAAGSMEQVAQIGSDPTFTPPAGKSYGFPTGTMGIALSVNYELRPNSGAIGSRLAVSYFNTGSGPFADSLAVGLIVLVGIKPFTGPSRPTITAPIDGEVITNTRTYAITWTPSTDPVIAQASLTYHIQRSLNDGQTWTDITAATSAGVTTFNWTPTGLVGTQVLLRMRANNGTEFGAYYTTGRFTLAADVLPNAPTAMHGEQPDGTTVTLFDLNSALIIKGVFSDTGDVMTGFQIDWGTDGVTYGNTSTTNSATFSKSYPGTPTFAAGTVYFRCRTKDTAGNYGPYTYFTLTAAAAPAAPNITAPTAGSPPNAPIPTISWTSTGQVKYRITIKQAGVTVYAGAFISSSVTSVTSPFVFLNSTTYTLEIDYQNSTGLTSAKDTETFTVSFTGPSTPTVTVS